MDAAAATLALESLVDQIKHIASPRRILLFGSAAKDMSTANDLDLLVILADSSDSRRMTERIYAGIRGVLVPFDVIVATQAGLAAHADNIGLIYRRALREGKEVYAA